MRRRAEGGEEQAGQSYYDVELLRKFALKICAEGFVPGDVLKEEFDGEGFTVGIAVLYRQFRMLREVRRPWKDDQEVLGYEWADRRFSKSQAKQIPADLGFLLELGKNIRPQYRDFVLVTATCRWTNMVLGAVPGKDSGGDLNVFEKDADGAVVIPAYCPRAMAYRALALIGKEPSAADRIAFSTLRIENPKITIVSHAITKGKQGLGIRRSEALEVGTQFVLEAHVPTSVLNVSEYTRMLRTAGKFVRLSPARSSGYGDFTVIAVE